VSPLIQAARSGKGKMFPFGGTSAMGWVEELRFKSIVEHELTQAAFSHDLLPQ
jgi:hypothetical protein